MPSAPKNKPKPLPIKVDIGSRLAGIRKAKGHTQETLSQLMGISPKQITDYETGRVHLNDEMIIRFSVALSTSADVLLGLKDVDGIMESPSIRFARRMRDLEQLPELKKKAILVILDDIIRANT